VTCPCLQVGFLPYLLRHVQLQPELAGLINTRGVAAAGHSRGGKLAALHLAGGPPGVMKWPSWVGGENPALGFAAFNPELHLLI
jgi:hypothetical protein